MPLAEADPAVLDEFNRNLAQYGEELATKQQNTFAAALGEARFEAEEPTVISDQMSQQQILQQRQRQEDLIKRNAKGVSPTLYAKMQRRESSAKPDTFSRRPFEGKHFCPLRPTSQPHSRESSGPLFADRSGHDGQRCGFSHLHVSALLRPCSHNL